MSIPSEGGEQPMQDAAADFPEIDDNAAVGDWSLFRRRCAFVEGSAVVDAHDAVALKRRFCLAYLGGRAQALGGVYMRLRPSVYTPAFIERLAAENATKRYARYPWLEQLIGLLQQLDQDQYISTPQHDNIVSRPRKQKLHVVPTTNSFA